MQSENDVASPTLAFRFYVGFALKLLALGTLLSVIPLVFVNIPMRTLFFEFSGPIYTLIMFALNATVVLVCFGVAAKLLFSWGVSGHKFSILPVNP